MITEKQLKVANECQSMLDRLDQAAKNHENGVADDLSPSMVAEVRNEVQQMLEALSNKQFKPSFGRFVLDWPDEHGLVDGLLKLLESYLRLR